MKQFKYIFIIVNFIISISTLQAQKFTCDNYFDYLPSCPKIICQTGASDSLNLYGNPNDSNYTDVEPVDGIDDQRFHRLLYLAAKFSPILRKNNFSSPQDFEKMLRIRFDNKRNKISFDNQAFLYVDTWDVTKPCGKRIKSEIIDLGTSTDSLENCNDTKLMKLIMEFHPDSLKSQKIDPAHHLQKLLYFDFPGKGEKTWRQIYKKACEKESKIYAHFFIHKDLSAQDSAKYELVIQYWFFYPFNDAANNHEGDWEHINVRITTKERKAQLLSTRDIQRILDYNNEDILDSLIIKKVDYYFHHFAIILDYQAMDFLQDRDSFKDSLKILKEEKMLQSWIYQQIYNRIHLVKDSLNTHPIGYIGAENMGLDQAIALPGGKNRNSHGTYPFPGIWKHIGPIGATERINGEKKYRFLLPEIEMMRFIGIDITTDESYYEPVENPKFVTYTKDDVILVPDWECVIDLIIKHPEIRRKWFWLILPLRWGFPAVESPGAGIIKHTDMGNVAPVGPAYNSSWNRVGATRGYEEYNPHVFPSQFLFGLQDNFHNSWGFFNITFPTLISLPGTNLIWSITGARFEFKPKFFAREEVPFRFASVVYRPFYTFGDNDFARLLLPQVEQLAINSPLIHYSNTATKTNNLKQENYPSFGSFMLNINLGRYASENTFSISKSKIRYTIPTGTTGSIHIIQGDLRFYEVMGSLKYCFFKSNFLPFLRIGYGWNWYRVENITLDGKPTGFKKTQWYHNPPFPYFPNTGHVGGGIEIFVERNFGIQQKQLLGHIFYIGKPEFGIRLEYTFHFHKLGKDAPVNDWIFRHELGAGIVVSF